MNVAEQIACPLFQAVLVKEESKTRMWEYLRAIFYTLPCESMAQIFEAMLYGYRIEGFVIAYDSS